MQISNNGFFTNYLNSNINHKSDTVTIIGLICYYLQVGSLKHFQKIT